MREIPLLDGAVQTADDRTEPILRAGNTNCGGCGMSIALNMLSHAARDRSIQLVIPACCAIVTAGPYPYSNYGAPVAATTFASAAAVASGLARTARLNGERTRVVAFAGDGGTYDIGMATLSAAAERNEDILYVCYDNEIYGNTGGQRSSATPLSAVTTTTSSGKEVPKKDILAIMAAHRIPYVASLSLAHPDDMARKLAFALDVEGFRFLHVLAPCPTGWKSEPCDGIELVRLAVRAGLYRVFEVFDGEHWVINVPSELSQPALDRYFSLQGRFRKTQSMRADVRRDVERSWRELERLAAHG
jgi:pyruvate ferredoxin oxidoreductase beta subunit/2-oxoisovalerate ferredoxin oxidoreductase beta subunit